MPPIFAHGCLLSDGTMFYNMLQEDCLAAGGTLVWGYGGGGFTGGDMTEGARFLDILV